MQTLQDSQPAPPQGHVGKALSRFLSAILVLLLTVLGTAACSNQSAVHVTDLEPAGSKPSPCESAYKRAHSRERSYGKPTDISTPQSREDTGQAWIEVAISCTTRVDEAAVHSAQAFLSAWLMENRDETNPRPRIDLTRQSFLSLDKAAQYLGQDAARQSALSEDQAGFALMTLAARQRDSEWLLPLADAHTTAAQTLVSHLDKDPRLGVYSVQDLLAHPDTMIDKANGLRTPTRALIEMNSARSILDSIGTMTETRSFPGRANKNSARYEHSTIRDREEGLRQLINLAVSHLYLALAFGYPNTPEALFDKQ